MHFNMEQWSQAFVCFEIFLVNCLEDHCLGHVVYDLGLAYDVLLQSELDIS